MSEYGKNLSKEHTHAEEHSGDDKPGHGINPRARVTRAE
jgi:hypothetical protein